MWPPDAFAIAASILKRSGAYRGVANVWPPTGFNKTEDWHQLISDASKAWRETCNSGTSWPAVIDAWWDEIVLQQNLTFDKITSDAAVFIALIGVTAASDQSSRHFGFYNAKTADASDNIAISNLGAKHTLCEDIDPTRVAVLPKAHNPVSGMTLRSLTHNLALWDRPEVSASWHSILVEEFESKTDINVLLLPWPLIINPTAFHEARNCHELGLPERVGLFEYDVSFDESTIPRIRELIEKARGMTGTVDAIVFPELSMSGANFRRLQDEIQKEMKIPMLVAGIGDSNERKLGTNDVAVSVDPKTRPYTQSKHHRWRLDYKQTSSYGITSLPEKKEHGAWWEAIQIEQRVCRFFNANEWLTFCVLICEDLARQDPVSELVRAVGPSLVIALLLDGPQIPQRWPAHYGTVLADDPRSSVLTLTSAGLVDLSRSQYGEGLRSVALWKDAISGSNRQIVLEPGSEGVLYT